MACNCCPMVRYLPFAALVLGIICLSSGLFLSQSGSDASLPEPVAAVTPTENLAVIGNPGEELNPTITTRDWQMVSTRTRGKR